MRAGNRTREQRIIFITPGPIRDAFKRGVHADWEFREEVV
jgi:hypothetical protein